MKIHFFNAKISQHVMACGITAEPDKGDRLPNSSVINEVTCKRCRNWLAKHCEKCGCKYSNESLDGGRCLGAFPNGDFCFTLINWTMDFSNI